MDPWCQYYFGLSELSISPGAIRAVFKKIIVSGTDAKAIWEKHESFPFVGYFGLLDQEKQIELVREAMDHLKWVGIAFPKPPEEIRSYL